MTKKPTPPEEPVVMTPELLADKLQEVAVLEARIADQLERLGQMLFLLGDAARRLGDDPGSEPKP
jgi:hypothetical protein